MRRRVQALEQQPKPQPVKPVFAKGSMEWQAEQEKAARTVASAPEPPFPQMGADGQSSSRPGTKGLNPSSSSGESCKPSVPQRRSEDRREAVADRNRLRRRRDRQLQHGLRRRRCTSAGGAVPIRSLWFLPDCRGAVPRPSTSLEDIGYVRGHIRRISVRMGRKIWASRFVHKAGGQNARHGSSPQRQRRQLCVTEAVNDMVIDHPSGLHKSVANRCSYELKAALSQILAHRIHRQRRPGSSRAFAE
jgi:hypothetical protein